MFDAAEEGEKGLRLPQQRSLHSRARKTTFLGCCTGEAFVLVIGAHGGASCSVAPTAPEVVLHSCIFTLLAGAPPPVVVHSSFAIVSFTGNGTTVHMPPSNDDNEGPLLVHSTNAKVLVKVEGQMLLLLFSLQPRSGGGGAAFARRLFSDGALSSGYMFVHVHRLFKLMYGIATEGTGDDDDDDDEYALHAMAPTARASMLHGSTYTYVVRDMYVGALERGMHVMARLLLLMRNGGHAVLTIAACAAGCTGNIVILPCTIIVSGSVELRAAPGDSVCILSVHQCMARMVQPATLRMKGLTVHAVSGTNLRAYFHKVACLWCCVRLRGLRVCGLLL